MPDPTRQAVRVLRGVEERVTQLEQAVSTGDVLPNVIRSVSEDGEATDQATLSTASAGAFQWDQDKWDNEKWQ